MKNALRFKHVLKEHNNTNNPAWSYYESYWLLQECIEGKFFDIPNVYFIEDENGNMKQISQEEYTELRNKNKR